MPYSINTSTASFTPYKQKWVDVQLGVNLSGRPIYRSTKDVSLTFDSAPLASYRQWENAVESASGGSITFQITRRDSTDFASFSAYPVMDKKPEFDQGISNGDWSVLLRGASPA